MKGYIIEYSSNNKSPFKRKIGHVLDCKRRNDVHSKSWQW